MPPPLHWPVIALRIALTLLAGGLLGIDRSRNGHPAGLRTTLLVTLAASFAMMLMDLLLPTGGKTSSSFATMDVMRLPLGILDGMGFIGAGAVLRRGEMVVGITTAATLWFATVVGLCLGSGNLALGCVAAVLGYLVLTVLRWLEGRIEQYQPATLTLVTTPDTLNPADLRRRLEAANFRIRAISLDHSSVDHHQTLRCELRWPSTHGAADLPPLLADLRLIPGLLRLSWHAVNTGGK